MPTAALSRPRVESGPDVLERPLLETLAYADVFDYPLRDGEIHRYLIGARATPRDVTGELARLQRAGVVGACQGFYTLAGRESLTDLRREREDRARMLWGRAYRYGRVIAALPFVLFVGVSGALAVDNVAAGADIDYFIVTERGRLWTARAMVVALVRWARRRGDAVCPNYLVSERAVALRDRNLFTAHELTQLVPLAGPLTYARLRASNPWATDYLPNAGGPPRATRVPACMRGRLRGAAEWLGRSVPGGWVEQWERRRKVRRFERDSSAATEASFGPDCCKGHFGQHGERVLAAYTRATARMRSWQA
jgi:hypothetical protein